MTTNQSRSVLNRRNLLSIGAGVTALAACRGASDRATTEVSGEIGTLQKRALNMTTTWPKGMPGLHTTAEYIALRVNELSAGAISIKVFAAGELVPPLEAFDAVVAGAVDMAHSGSGYWANKSKAFPIFTTVPLGMTTTETFAWLKFGMGQSLWDQLTSQFGVKSIPAGTTGHQMGGFFRKSVRSADDFIGLKYRIAGLGADVARELGASAVTIPGGEVFQALQTGTIDATEFVGPWNDRSLGLGRVAPYYYGPGFHEPGSIMSMDFNLALWNSMSDLEQSIIESACADACLYTMAQYHHYNSKALRQMVQEDGIKVSHFPEDVLEKVRSALPKVLKSVSNAGELEAKIVASYMEHLELYSTWSDVGDAGFVELRD